MPPHARSRRLPAIRPVQLEQVELSEPLGAVLPRTGPGGSAYDRAEVLVTLHGAPLGTVALSLEAGAISPPALAARIRAAVGPGIARHLALHGLVAGDLLRLDLTAVPDTCRPAAPAAPPSITVVVATRNRPEHVATCLDALLRSSYPAFEVLVVDNAPDTEATADVVAARAAGDPRVRYLREPRAGASRARNRGIAAATGDVVAFTDDDVVVGEQWLQVIGAELGSGTSAVLTGLTRPLRLDHAAAVCYERAGGFGMGWDRRVFAVSDGLADGPATRLFPFTSSCGSSNNLAVRLEALRRVHGFDERLGPGTRARGGEDLDLLTRLLLAGESVVYQPRALVRHDHRIDAESLSAQLLTYGAGATAVLTKWTLRRRDLRRRLLVLAMTATAEAGRRARRRVGAGADAGPSTAAGEVSLPGWLRRRVLLGYALGPLLWARSSADGRRRRRGLPPSGAGGSAEGSQADAERRQDLEVGHPRRRAGEAEQRVRTHG